MINATFASRRALLGAALVLALATAAEAGPPLICHPFTTGAAPLLAWGTGSGWNTPDGSYDVRRLTADTTRLLTPQAPVLARMENLRRATIYASQNREVAYELLTTLVGRALSVAASGSQDPLPWFDAAYAIEAFRQAGSLQRWNAGTRRAAEFYSEELAPLKGYVFMQKAIALAGTNAEMEFAAALMQQGTAAAEHRRRAIAGATSGSPLAKNIELYLER